VADRSPQPARQEAPEGKETVTATERAESLLPEIRKRFWCESAGGANAVVRILAKAIREAEREAAEKAAEKAAVVAFIRGKVGRPPNAKPPAPPAKKPGRKKS
jgi:hypothetical protein